MWTFTGCVSTPSRSAPTVATMPQLPPASTLPADDDAIEGSIRFLEDRVKGDPDDFIAYNKLAGYYLKQLRHTGEPNYIELALRAAQASLAAIPAEQNLGGLAALAQVEFAAHHFTASRDHARELMRRDPGKSYPYLILGDSLLELGDYDEATAVFAQLEQRSDDDAAGSIAVETRLGQLALLKGHTDAAKRHFAVALLAALDDTVPPRETAAWCRWRLGEIAFSIGDYATAELHYRDALITFPDYFRALASLGRVRAAQGDMFAAIEHYQRAIKILPDPSFMTELGDIYKVMGRSKGAAKQYKRVQELYLHMAGRDHIHDRQLAMFYADHDLKVEVAYAIAVHDYEVRHDIYAADALAWTALKAGKIPEAQIAIKNALRLGTRDAKLWYHAGMIARAAGERDLASDYLKRALGLNPSFDPLQSQIARTILETEL